MKCAGFCAAGSSTVRAPRHRAALQRLERQPVPRPHHQFAIEDQAVRQLPRRGAQVGEVPIAPPARFGVINRAR
jgi:hypothetical protein